MKLEDKPLYEYFFFFKFDSVKNGRISFLGTSNVFLVFSKCIHRCTRVFGCLSIEWYWLFISMPREFYNWRRRFDFLLIVSYLPEVEFARQEKGRFLIPLICIKCVKQFFQIDLQFMAFGYYIRWRKGGKCLAWLWNWSMQTNLNLDTEKSGLELILSFFSSVSIWRR